MNSVSVSRCGEPAPKARGNTPSAAEHADGEGYYCAGLRPHFVFNAISLVSALMLQDPPKAREILLDLADLLRAGIDFARGGEHSLNEEMEWIRLYAGIQKERFGDRFSIAYDTAGWKNSALPAFSLLTPAARAIHEALQSGEYGNILVGAEETRDGVRLSVRLACGDGAVRPICEPMGREQ